ncbi:type I polyketide synthase [Streptomyces diastaticus]|uniref:type I polyketide synthase n=1 Tax=Streptomyces diastaticus TaxID=1956 RepID=UPI003646885F
MSRDPSLDVTVTGLAARLPGPAHLGRWWEAVLDGQVLTTRLERDVLVEVGISPTLVDDPRYVPVRGLLAEAYRFDNEFFGISPREAQLMDPQHRLALEVGWQALEDAGVNPSHDTRHTAVFASSTGSTYLRAFIERGAVDSGTLDDLIHGCEPDFMASRISYKLGLTGPALSVQTACSSSLVGVHLAVQSLLSGDCDQALVVATGMAFPQGGQLAVPGGIHSPSGNCRPFCGTADGVVGGSGAAAVVLRRAEDSAADRVTPHGVILGTAINNDGSGKAGYYAPSITGQQQAIRSALATAQVGADSLGYLETHGTGTPIGDPIEWEAATAALSADGAREHQVAVGAVKANVGHLDACAGLAALIKTLLVLKTGLIPPVAGFHKLNPLLETTRSPLYVPTTASSWTGAAPRRAGVSAFGIGGTNTHIVLEQAAAPPLTGAAERPRIIALSAGDDGALDRLTAATAESLDSGTALADAAHTLAHGRAALGRRRTVAAASGAAAAALLRDRSAGARGAVDAQGPGPLVFLYPGQGTQSRGMALPYQEALPGFRAELERCLEFLPEPQRSDVRAALLDPSAPEGALDETALAQPAVVAVQIAVTASLGALGLRPDGVLGHSLGELGAAVASGVLTAEEAVGFAAVRGRAMQSCPVGAMLALGCGEDRARELIAGTGLDLAAVNAPEACVVAGPVREIDRLAAGLPNDLVRRRLRTTRAFHSSLIDGCLDELAEAAGQLSVRPALVPFASAVQARVIQRGHRLDPAVWSAGARLPVRFHAALTELTRALPGAVALELGPGRPLTPAVAASDVPCSALGNVPGNADALPLLEGLAELWAAGLPLDLSRLSSDGSPVHLPVHPFRGPVHVAPEVSGPRTETAPGAAIPAGPGTTPGTAADEAAGAGDDRSAPPADPTEAVVATWRSYLGRQDLAADSDFFHLGGDSLLITRMVRRLGEELGVRVPVRAMLAARTLGKQTEVVRRAMEDA